MLSDRVAEPYWSDRQVFIVGGGPSLEGRDLASLRARGIVLGVNRAADFWPCDATFSFDQNFLRGRVRDLHLWAENGQEVYGALEESWTLPRAQGVRYLRRITAAGLSRDPGTIHSGKTSGFGALNLAVLKGARRIALLGFDFKTGRDGRRHWHDGYTWGSGTTKYYETWAKAFDSVELPEGVEVVNANPDSGLRKFPFTTYDALEIPMERKIAGAEREAG